MADLIIDEIGIINFLDYIQVPRIIPDYSNPLDSFGETEFQRTFRFWKEVVRDILMPLVLPRLRKTSSRGLPISPLLQLLTVLRFYATGDFQIVCGDLHEISQPTVSRIVRRISETICDVRHRYIKFPEYLNEVKDQFYRIRRFPGVIGCIDCTHIPIMCPQKDRGEDFCNRKGTFSLNVQVIGGPDLKIYDIVCQWPGSAHDSQIFANSAVKINLEENRLDGFLLGDNGYPQLQYLFTPVLNPTTQAQERYNRAQISTRNTVERLFGILKRRFHCLSSKLSTKIETILLIVPAVAVLHNIAITMNELEPEIVKDMPHFVQPDVANYQQRGIRGNVIKAQFIERFFRR